MSSGQDGPSDADGFDDVSPDAETRPATDAFEQQNSKGQGSQPQGATAGSHRGAPTALIPGHALGGAGVPVERSLGALGKSKFLNTPSGAGNPLAEEDDGLHDVATEDHDFGADGESSAEATATGEHEVDPVAPTDDIRLPDQTALHDPSTETASALAASTAAGPSESTGPHQASAADSHEARGSAEGDGLPMEAPAVPQGFTRDDAKTLRLPPEMFLDDETAKDPAGGGGVGRRWLRVVLALLLTAFTAGATIGAGLWWRSSQATRDGGANGEEATSGQQPQGKTDPSPAGKEPADTEAEQAKDGTDSQPAEPEEEAQRTAEEAESSADPEARESDLEEGKGRRARKARRARSRTRSSKSGRSSKRDGRDLATTNDPSSGEPAGAGPKKVGLGKVRDSSKAKVRGLAKRLRDGLSGGLRSAKGVSYGKPPKRGYVVDAWVQKVRTKKVKEGNLVEVTCSATVSALPGRGMRFNTQATAGVGTGEALTTSAKEELTKDALRECSRALVEDLVPFLRK